MSELAIKAMNFAERMKDGPYVHLKEVRDLLNECSEAIDANETHEAMLNQMLDDKAALITELVEALEGCTEHIEHSTPQGKAAWDKAKSLITKAKGSEK